MAATRIVIALGALATCASATCTYYEPTTVIPFDTVPATVDQSATFNGTYYLADRSNNVVHVADIATGTWIANITGFAGVRKNPATGKVDTHISGPDGLVLLPDRQELYIGDANGTIQVASTCSNTVVASIDVGSLFRADEFAYDPEAGIVVCTVPNNIPPFVAVIDVAARTMIGKIDFADASGLEQPRFDTEGEAFYVSVPDTKDYPTGALAKLDVSSMTVVKWLGLSDILPAGIKFGDPEQQQIFIGASEDQILTLNESRSVIIDIEGDVIANITGLAGIDQVDYDLKKELFFASAYKNKDPPNENGTAIPALAIISGHTKKLLQTIVTDPVLAHAVAVDQETHKVLVPTSLVGGVQIYELVTSDGDCTNTTNSTIYASIPS